jgi:hypothetical protein
MQHPVTVRTHHGEVTESCGERACGLGEWDDVVAFDVPGTVLAVDRLEVERAYLTGKPTGLLLDRLLLAFNEPPVAFPHAVASVEDAALSGLVLTVLGSQRGGLLPGCFGAYRGGEVAEPISVVVNSSHTSRSRWLPCCIPAPG